MLAVEAQSFTLDNLPFGWFDFVFVAVLGFGFFRGRKNGMTKEVLPMLQWVATVLAAGLGYELVGQVILNVAGMGQTASNILGYLVVTFLVYLVFVVLKKVLMPKLTGSNFFGSMEYYLGTASGVIRFFCILFFAMALLNAPYYSPAEIAAHKEYSAKWYGGGLKGYSGDYFPTMQSVQESVFEKSFLGRNIKEYIGIFLIASGPGNTGKPGSASQQPKPIIHIGN